MSGNMKKIKFFAIFGYPKILIEILCKHAEKLENLAVPRGIPLERKFPCENSFFCLLIKD